MNNLPELPKKLNKREARITPLVLKWFQNNYKHSVALEIKASNTNTIPTRALKPHQLKALVACGTKRGLSHKIADTGHVQLPMDAFIMKNTTSFVIACFTKHGICHAIDPKTWNGARYNMTTQTFSFPLR